jgi:hypothetical protein
LITLGTAAAESQQPLVNSNPLLRKVGTLAKKAAPGAHTLGRLLTSLRKTGAYKDLMGFLYNTTGGVNGYDQYGHFLRAFLTIPPGCTTLSTTQTLGCEATWGQAASKANKAAALKASHSVTAASLKAQAKALAKRNGGGTPAGAAGGASTSGGSPTAPPGQPLDAQGEPPAGTTTTTPTTGTSALPQPHRPSLGALRDLLDAVIGGQHHSSRGAKR